MTASGPFRVSSALSLDIGGGSIYVANDRTQESCRSLVIDFPKADDRLWPQQISAGIGNLKVIAFSGAQAGRQWVHMEISEGSYGGRFRRDGMDAVDTLYANTRNNPIEDIESHLPLRVTRYELREDACGAGEWRGGLGSVREFVYLSDGGASVEGEGHRYQPWGFDGGLEGQSAEAWLRPQLAEPVYWHQSR
jgi:N-methylhydantoinase B/oxoprolinase/acetone carboxylase alpha subunit